MFKTDSLAENILYLIIIIEQDLVVISKERKKRPKRVIVWGPQNTQAYALQRHAEGVKLESVKPHLYKVITVDHDCGGGEE